MLKKLLLMLLGLGFSYPLQSQVTGSAQGPARQFLIGAEYSRLNPDYWNYPTIYESGLSVYASYNVLVKHHAGFGLEGTWRSLLDHQGGTHRVDSYVISGRYMYRFYRFMPFVKAGGGLGYFNSGGSEYHNKIPGQNGVHLVAAVGAGLDVRLTKHVTLRPLEWEQQVWTFTPNLLAPHSYSFGAAYRFR